MWLGVCPVILKLSMVFVPVKFMWVECGFAEKSEAQCCAPHQLALLSDTRLA